MPPLYTFPTAPAAAADPRRTPLPKAQVQFQKIEKRKCLLLACFWAPRLLKVAPRWPRWLQRGPRWLDQHIFGFNASPLYPPKGSCCSRRPSPYTPAGGQKNNPKNIEKQKVCSWTSSCLFLSCFWAPRLPKVAPRLPCVHVYVCMYIYR